jgi:hypothetical protein
MKGLTKQIFASLIMACGLLACNPTDELINESVIEPTNVKPMRRSAGNSVLNALTFDSIAQADAMLEAMQSIDNANVFYNTYISGNHVNNKYLTSIHEYLSILNSIDGGDTITARLAFEALQDSLFNVVIEDGDTIVEPLACFDYRCLVNEDNIFVVDDRIYHLFDTIFITCPIDRHSELLEMSKNRLQFMMLVEELKREPVDVPSIMQARVGIYDDLIPDLEIIYVYEPTSGIHELDYEKTIGKHRMRVSINASEHYASFYERHDFKTEYKIRSHNKWAGIWWIKNEKLDIDISYLVEYALLFRTLELSVDHNYTTKGFYPSYKKSTSVPFTDEIYVNTYGINYVHFTISNQYMTITNADEK